MVVARHERVRAVYHRFRQILFPRQLTHCPLASDRASLDGHLIHQAPELFLFLLFLFMEFRRAILLLMLPGRAVDAAGAVGGRTAPDALVRPGTVTVFARRGMDAARAIGRGTAPFAMPLVVTVLVLARRAVDAARTIAR